MRYIWLMGKALVMIPVKVFFYFFPGLALKTSISLEEDKLRSAAQAIGQQKGMIARLQRLVDEGTKEVSKLTAGIERAMKDGNEATARGLAEKLVAARKRLETNTNQLSSISSSYESNVALLKSNANLIQEAKQDVKTLEVSLEVAKAKKSQSELAASLKGGLGSMGLLSEARENMQGQIDSLEGEAELISDIAGVDANSDSGYNTDVEDVMAEMRSKFAVADKENHLETVLAATELSQTV